MREHEVPTHVQAEDRVLLGFTFPQVVAVRAVFALSYGAYRYLRPGVEGGLTLDSRDDAPGQSEKQGAKIPADHLGRASTRFPGGS